MPEKKLRVTRRDMLRASAGAAAFLGVAPRASAQEAPAKLKGIQRLGPGPTSLKLTLNGRPAALSVEPRETLLDALREGAGLTGAKRICDRGACGGCTVWLDGKTVNACMTLALDAQGATVRTVEGLAKGETLHPIQEAFVDCDALQCGYCTSGMLMSCAAFLASKAEPSEAAIREAISGNLCRCGTYPHIVDACKKASKS